MQPPLGRALILKDQPKINRRADDRRSWDPRVLVMDTPIIETHGFTKSFGAVAAVSDVSMSVRRGEVYGFLGPNGAGKTTTLRMLLGLARPTSGTAIVA